MRYTSRNPDRNPAKKAKTGSTSGKSGIRILGDPKGGMNREEEKKGTAREGLKRHKALNEIETAEKRR